MVQWNENQHKAIYTKDKNILISASAGAGKTTVLIARLMHLIEDEGIGVDEILAMTFSEAAASEMKKRLSTALYAKLETEPDDVFLKKQLANLNNANISTIHGFCLNIMKEYYYIIALDKKRIENPMDPAQTNIVKDQAMQQVLNRYYEHPNFYKMSKYFTMQLDKNGSLEDSIQAFATLANAKSEPLKFLDACMQDYQLITSLKDVKEDIFKSFKEYFYAKTKLLLDLIDISYEHDQVDSLLDKKEWCQDALLSLDQNDYEAYREAFMNGMLCKYGSSAQEDHVKEPLGIEKEILEELFSEEDFVTFHNEGVSIVSLLCEMTKAYLQVYDNLKKEEGVIDFDDMEHYALSILKADNYYVASLYKEKFKAIMVDEFQDSNDVQDELVNLICQDSNVFRVGDIKQSIYGFRHALPAIMKNLIRNQSDQDEVIYLGHNYRSSKMIVDFNNQLFDTLMNVEAASSSYSKQDYVLTGIPEQERIKIPTTMHLLSDSLKAESGYTTAELKNQYIAHLIQDLHDSKGMDYKDIVVLARGNGHLAEVAAVLEELHIPCFYNKTQGFYNSDVIQIILSFLNALINPYNDIALLSILTSPIYKVSSQDLAKAKLAIGKDEHFYTYFKEQTFFSSFNDIKAKLYKVLLTEVFDEIYNLNGFYENYTTRQEKANLDMLYEVAVSYEEKEAISIHGFVRYVEQQKDMQVAEAMPIGANDDVVRIMTIHKAKGLQFKAVIMYVATGGLSLKESSDMAVFDSSLRIGLKHYDDKVYATYVTPEVLAIKQKQIKEMLEEEMRLLYVATTRAQEQMHIVDMNKEKNIRAFNTYSFYKSKNYADWIMSTFVNKDSDVLAYQYVEEMWVIKGEETYEERYVSSHYTKKSSTFSLMSPSDTELVAHKPGVFDLYASDGFERGTTLHRMVEVLPNTQWTASMIQDAAVDEDFMLSNHDEEVLLALSNNEVFKDCLSLPNVYHEYPYMIKEEKYVSHGFMDFLAYDDTKVIMIDFKSDRGVDETVLLERYEKQIVEYRKALLVLFPKHKIETNIYSFELQKMIVI